WVANPQVGRLNHGRDFTLISGFAVQIDGATSTRRYLRFRMYLFDMACMLSKSENNNKRGRNS
ncbi:hypothetical protein, partial [Methylomonas methanica]|uniref:hypothetical protein n=1 Tax=Methylomonas methanica TaxID=421 RepID=UPI001A9E2ABD